MLLDKLKGIHVLLKKAKIDHALIGGLALGAHGVQRYTNDIDFLINESDIENLIALLEKNNFEVFHKSSDVLQLTGDIPIDVIIARRPISTRMLKEAKEIKSLGIKCVSVEGLIALKVQAYKNNPKRELRDKADIQALIENNDVNWKKLKPLVDLFQEWNEIEKIRKLVDV